MIKKTYLKTGNNCRVTFRVPANVKADQVSLVGEFNKWSDTRHAMTRRKDGSFSTTVTLKAGRDYRFKYLVNAATWLNDSEADGEVANEFGTRDSIIRL